MGVLLRFFRKKRTFERRASGTATVSVTDRFGQVWTRTVSW